MRVIEVNACAVVTAVAAAALWLRSGTAQAADLAVGEQKAQACAACHGPEGNSILPTVPSLAGQPAQFIATQLLMFREGRRKDAQMSPMAVGLSNADLNNIAAYFASRKLIPPKRNAGAASLEAGPRLAQQHNCTQCHGAALTGQQHIPRLAGQQYDYLVAQLRSFKASTRFDMDGQMTSTAQALSDADITVLADYLSAMK